MDFLNVTIFSFLISGLLLFWFVRNNRQSIRRHLERVKILEQTIALHRKQLQNRNAHLNDYDFRQYNLDEVLIIQSEIIV